MSEKRDERKVDRERGGAGFEAFADLAGERLGGAVLWANDDFFAAKERLIRAGEPVWREGVYTERGKWMDGWETRRRRQPGHDVCLLRLAGAGVVRGVVVDTRFFRGNHPEACTLEGADLSAVRGGSPRLDELRGGEVDWRPLVPRSPLGGDALHRFAVGDGRAGDGDDGDGARRVTHLRFSIFPDGGVARLRVHGEPRPDWPALAARREVDLAAALLGGRVLAASDAFFGRGDHLLAPGPPRGMHDGWETRRKRGRQPDDPHDWIVVRLARPGRLHRVVVDTSFFKGNAPGSCGVEGCAAGEYASDRAAPWRPLVPRTPLEPHRVHELAVAGDAAVATVSHLRLSIFPDGGVARLRAFGTFGGDGGGGDGGGPA